MSPALEKPETTGGEIAHGIGIDEPFECLIDGPNVSLNRVYPVVERGAGWISVIALAASKDAQKYIADAMKQRDALLAAARRAQSLLVFEGDPSTLAAIDGVEHQDIVETYEALSNAIAKATGGA